jgi:type I restriction enzyme R subunit
MLLKQETDRAVLGNSNLLNKSAFFEKQTMPIVIGRFRDPPPAPDAENIKLINGLLVKEYLEQARGHLSF